MGRSPKDFSGEEVGQCAAVLFHMEHLSTISKNADIQGRVKFVAAKMKDVHFTAFWHFLADSFSILSKLSLQMQRNDLILPVSVSLLKETMARVECIMSRPIPNGHLAAFLKHVEGGNNFQSIQLTGSIEGTATSKRGGGFPKSLQSEIDTAVDLRTQGLNERFAILINASETTKSKKEEAYGPQKDVSDMLFLNVDVCPSNPIDLVDYGREEIQRLILQSGSDHCFIKQDAISMQSMTSGYPSKFW